MGTVLKSEDGRGEALQSRIQVDSKGRMVIPAAMREALGISDASPLVARVEDNELRISTIRARILRAQASVRHLVPPGTLVSDELSAERREAAKNE
jgi:AbrB family looped-hinge helix DNA binding protein